MTTIDLPAEELETWLGDGDGWTMTLYGQHVPEEHKPIPPPPATAHAHWLMPSCISEGVIVLQGGIPRRTLAMTPPCRFLAGDRLHVELIWTVKRDT